MTAATLLFVAAVLLLIVVVIAVVGVVIEGRTMATAAPLIAPSLVVAAISLFASRLNLLWFRRLRAEHAQSEIPGHKRGVSLRELPLAVGVVVVMLGATSQLIRSAPAKYAENVDVSAVPYQLPEGATDASYCKGARGTIALEFSVAESDFRGWVASGIGSIESQVAGARLEEIKQSFTIKRYSAYSLELDGASDITVTNGLRYSWSKEDRGVHAAYDRTTGRAYFQAHCH